MRSSVARLSCDSWASTQPIPIAPQDLRQGNLYWNGEVRRIFVESVNSFPQFFVRTKAKVEG
jgi:hypothetical protein